MASSPTRWSVTERWIGYRRCESQKVSYDAKDDALTAAERMMDAGRVRVGCHITPYLCPDCDRWHVANRVIVELGRRKRLTEGKIPRG